MNPTRHLLLAASFTLCSAAVLAEAQTYNVDIPAQPLSSALEALAQQTGIRPFYSDAIVAGKTSRAVSGRLTAEQALSRLLSGSGSSHRFNSDKAVAITAAETDAKTLPPVTVSGQAEYDSTDPYNKSYTVTNSSTATKTDTPLIETPVSVQVVPRSVMDDQKTTRIKDALENVSGVRAQPTLGGGNGFIIRGFRNGTVYRNGLLTNGNAFVGFPSEFDAGNLQSIDVLKGPAAVLFGRIEPGGLINITTKKPLDIPYYSLEQQFGSYDYYRTQWDATGAITDDKSLLYRFTGAYQNNNSFRDFVFTDRVMVNPSITWRPTEMTDLTLNVEGLDQDYQTDFGIPAMGNRPAPVPISRSIGDPNDPVDHISKALVSTEINHRFNNDWAVHNRFLASFNNEYTKYLTPSPTGVLGPDGIVKRNIFGHDNELESYSTNLDLTGKFRLGFSEHDILVGFDYFQSTQKYHSFGEYAFPNNSLDINIFNPYPSYGISPELFRQTLAQPNSCCGGKDFAFIYSQWYGAYFQDQITLWDKLHILGGGRYDWADSGFSYKTSFELAEATLPSNKVDGFSPRVGILYQPVPWLGVYGNWTTSFNANNAPAANGSTFDPQRGEQFEAGVKTQVFDDRLIATLAYYHLVKDNILVPDLATANLFDRISNKQRSQGIELDITGQITNQLSLIGSYAFTDARILEDHVAEGDPSNAGHRMPNVPEHSGSLWFKYDVNGYDSPEGFSFGIGGIAAGQRQGDFANSFQLPGFVRMDAFAAYRMKVGATKVTTQFNIRNLLDKNYYESTDPDLNTSPNLSIAPGAPLMANGSIRVEF